MSVEKPEAWVVISRHSAGGSEYLNVRPLTVYRSRQTAVMMAGYMQREADANPNAPKGVTYHVVGGRLGNLE